MSLFQVSYLKVAAGLAHPYRGPLPMDYNSQPPVSRLPCFFPARRSGNRGPFPPSNPYRENKGKGAFLNDNSPSTAVRHVHAPLPGSLIGLLARS